MTKLRPGFLWLAGVRDLQWRRRRFVIAVFGTALVLSLTLMMQGYQATFGVEVNKTVKLIDADGYVVPAGRAGPFLGGTPMPLDVATAVQTSPGVRAASPLIMVPQVTDQKKLADVFLIAAGDGELGRPEPTKGHLYRAPRDAVIDTSSGLGVGDRFAIGGEQFRVSGTVSGETYSGGRPTVYISLRDAQDLLFAGQPLVTSVAVKGTPASLPDGVEFQTAAVAANDLKRPMASQVKSITMFNAMLWVVAIALVGSVIYLSALERVGDFAVFKATGTSTLDLLGALVLQAVVLSVSASILAIGLAHILAPMFPAPPILRTGPQLMLPFIGLAIGAVASIAALRRAVSVDPALAFG